MKAPYVHAAIDLGASSARLFAGRIDGDRLSASEVTRLANVPVRWPDGWHWDVARIHQGMLEGLAQLSRQVDGEPIWAGIDGWGVDYGLLDPSGHLLGLPYHYRDDRTSGYPRLLDEAVGRARVYEATGIQELELNTIFQLMSERNSTAYAGAAQLLMVPDLLAYFLTGEGRFERTNASTTQLVDSRTGDLVGWMTEVLGLRKELFAPPVQPGEMLGPVLTEVAASVALKSALSVVAVASHDTASAVLAVPAAVDDFAYVVSGTWSLVGFELDRPVINEASRQANFSNELGVDGTVRFLRNTMGFWMLQECERSWAGPEGPRDLGKLLAAAARRPPFACLVQTSDPAFARPGNMPARVRGACARSGQAVPDDDAEVVRCILDSMALAIAETLEAGERCAQRHASVVHVVGGGAANDLFLELLAAATGVEVVAGPVEASAIGNLLVQLRTAGLVGERKEMRALVAGSFPVKRVAPDPDLRRLAQRARRRLAELPASRTGPGGN
jgi:rhamnulokinase